MTRYKPSILSPTITHNLRIFSDAKQKTNLGKSASYVNKSIDHSYYYLIITKPSLITVATNVSLQTLLHNEESCIVYKKRKHQIINNLF